LTLAAGGVSSLAGSNSIDRVFRTLTLPRPLPGSVIAAPRCWSQIRAGFHAGHLPMLRDGKYAAWFRTPRGQGTGIVHLAEGRISGRDSFFAYGGSYRVDAQQFSAVLTVKRCADGPSNVFGPDEVEVDLAGVCSGALATCSGTAREAPEIRFEATLIYSQDDEPAMGARQAVVKLNADKLSNKLPHKLPRGLDSRSRQRDPFVPPGPSAS
jgi:hypothetical protein